MAYRMAVITDPETATGFRLAGVEVREADSPRAALEHLRTLLTLDYGLIAVNEALLEGTEEERARLMRDRDLPILVPFPAARAEVETGEAYIARLVKEHIGFYVKLR
ncbi:MAG: V-type ATP synthase subunit F [Armatimonadota bacterium]|nr:V-type ATP synthase subunit F [Armatimonadota bacterium]MDR7451486.1 V-type ATP synthase subunit F [Armatimonadota bacterium]MDR7467453.1 V-type ATP synthase subunit F [Armatimonadota bacterium]MDR7494327.1 V-type ATP synthase subunit F [Armatimonadota bacterium]MDR7499144.1 V-type ATP synthase subunit F [Armatimonadota bacterium]